MTVSQSGWPVVKARIFLLRCVLRLSQITMTGVAVDPRGQPLLTMPDGIARADLSTGVIDWAVPIPGCRRSALALADGSILVLHGAAVLRWRDNAIEVVGGAFTGETSLLPVQM